MVTGEEEEADNLLLTHLEQILPSSSTATTLNTFARSSLLIEPDIIEGSRQKFGHTQGGGVDTNKMNMNTGLRLVMMLLLSVVLIMLLL